MVVSPRPSHTFWVFVVRNNVAVFGELLVADGALSALLDNLPVQQLAHLGWRPEFPVSPWIVRIFDALHAEPQSSFHLSLLTAAAEQRAVDRTQFVLSKSHENSPRGSI
jgi:hypothetical protein